MCTEITRKTFSSTITCVFKSGDSHLFENYRPISVLPIFSKFIEKLVTIRLYTHFLNCNILTPSQFGYREDLSTLDAVNSIVDFLYGSFDRKKKVIGVFVDLSKAFDCLDRRKILLKLSQYGVTGTALSWFKSYFLNRRQFVNYDGVSSSVSEVGYGIAQGSILSPLLFALMMNDLPDKIASKLNVYADDICFTSPG